MSAKKFAKAIIEKSNTQQEMVAELTKVYQVNQDNGRPGAKNQDKVIKAIEELAIAAGRAAEERGGSEMTTKAQEAKRDELLKMAETKRYKRGWVWHRLVEEYGKEVASELLPREKKQRPFSHVAEDEQVAVHSAIERERLEEGPHDYEGVSSRLTCPDCGAWMEVERGGNAYCERCEG